MGMDQYSEARVRASPRLNYGEHMMPSSDLPVREALPALLAALRAGGSAVLVAPPGSGKTTLMPLALADAIDGRIIVAEPRRVAARAAASRMAGLTGTQIGDLVGFAVRGEQRTSRRTRVEVVTTGLLVRRMQSDPELAGVGAMVIDECHERHLDTDLALAFGIEVRAALRPELVLVATSATAQAERLAETLGAPIITADGRVHPVEVIWAPPTGPIDAPYGLRVDPRLLDHVAALIRRSLRSDDGDILAFLPGAGELNTVASRLSGLDGVDVLTLHGRQSPQTQTAVLQPSSRRRVVLATAVAESSLTVPGVRIVIDAGLARVPRTDHSRGLDALVTIRASRASAAQRAGRAGREGPGRVYRCWTEAEHERLPEFPEPEVAGADLTSFLLQLARWGHPDPAGAALLDQPPAAALQVARATLLALGAVSADGRITTRGQAIADVGAHPRLARALLDAAEAMGAQRAAETVAVLSGDSIPPGDDLPAAVRRLRQSSDPLWRKEVRRLTAAVPATAHSRTVGATGPGVAGSSGSGVGGIAGPGTTGTGVAGVSQAASLPDDAAAALVVALAYPERLARIRGTGSHTYLMAGGTGAELSESSSLHGFPWLAVASVDRQPGRRDGRIILAAPIDEQTARFAGAALFSEAEEVSWLDGDVVARQVTRLGAIVLTERPIKPSPALAAAALAEGLRKEGLALLHWSSESRRLRARLAFLHQALGTPWPDVSDTALMARAGEWLAGASRRADLARLNMTSALRQLLPWQQVSQLDDFAPERVEVPSGSRIAVDYTDPGGPVLAVKLQETFGWKATPRLANGRVPLVLHLLSPAGRPAAVTADLESFWRNGYHQVRAELRGRYPRHPWPDDPTTAAPTKRPTPRRP
jgi:ATP-dependent helicase HrpB